MPHDNEFAFDAATMLDAGGAETNSSLASKQSEFEEDVARVALSGLEGAIKTLPPSLFYDAEGCRLFYAITELPEYYLTRAELGLLKECVNEVAAAFPPATTLVEYGASDETKAAMLLRQSTAGGEPVFRTYIPIDVADSALSVLRRRMGRTFPDLAVSPVAADFMRPILLPIRDSEAAVLGFFPGSTIGNLEPEAAVSFLRRARTTLGFGARFLMGFDTGRDPARLIPAYDDAQGVTAAFNRNLLTRLNREAGADFDPASFAHQARWNAEESRVEMHLVSSTAQTVRVAGRAVSFAPGESIHTENSYKYSPERMNLMIEAAGWSRQETWTAPNRLFSLWLLG